MDDQSEPVRVFVRIRPEFEDRSTDKSTPSKSVNVNSRGQPTLSVTTNNCCAIIDQHNLQLMPPDGVYGSRKSVSAMDDKVFTFDKVFPDSSTQEDIYRSVSDQIHAAVRGYNATIFAYGTTGSGKSYTMSGNKAAPGIIPRAIGDLFRHIENAAAEENDVFFYVRLSYVELYNNNFRNLLDNVKSNGTGSKLNTSVNMSMNGFFTELDDGGETGPHGTSFAHARNSSGFDVKLHPGLAHRNDKIEVRESQSAGVFLAGPNLRIPVTSAVESYQLIAKGNKNRAVGATACNDVSSRSHAILTFHVESRILSSMNGTSTSNTSSASVKSELRLGKIHLVDLAGSERLALSGAEGDTRLETQSINKALTALGDVLSALSKNATVQQQHQKKLLSASNASIAAAGRSLRPGDSFDGSFSTLKSAPTLVPVPYRNSKLTHLLKDSLGGNSKTVMICTIRTTDEYYQQTSISLEYATRARRIRNRSLVNRNVIGDTGIHAVSSEIERLKKSLEERTVEFDRLRMTQQQDAQENTSLKVRLQELKLANENERALLEQQVSHVIHSQAGHIASQREKISTLQTALQEELTLSQNRIAEQEKEIKWLKKALDETSQAAQGPFDQMQRLQKMVEAWQTQAKTTHQELSVVLKQAEELKTMNLQLTSKLNEVDAARRQLQEEISEHEQDAIDASSNLSKLHREKEELQEQVGSLERAYQDAKTGLKEKAEALFDKEFVLKEHAKLITALEQELKATKETSVAIQKDSAQQAAKLAAKVSELENDKNELTSRLNNAVSTLEKSTARVVEDANAKMQAKDSKIKQADEKANLLKGEVDHYKKLMEDYKRQLDTREAVQEQTISELRANLKEEQVANAQQAARILSLESLADDFRDKILKLKTKDKEMMDSLRAQVEKHEKEIREKDRALFILGEQRDSERVTLMTEFERILEEKTLKHQNDLREAHEGATISAERMEEIELRHKAELSRLEVEYSSKEAFFQHQLQETESQVKLMIEGEIDQNIKKLEAQHQAQISKLRHDHELELRAALQEAMAASSSAAHKQHVHAMEQRHAVYTAELDTMRNEFNLQLKAAQEDAAAQREAIVKTHEENVAKLQKTHQAALDQLENKISEQCEAHYDATLKAHDVKHRQELIAAVEREHNKLTTHYETLVLTLRNDAAAMKEKHQEALKNIDYQRELHLQDAIEAERSRLLIQSQQQSDEQRSTLAADFNERLSEQERRLTAKFTAQIESERQQVMGEQEEALQRLATEQRRQIDTLTHQMEEAQAHHVREMDLLMNSHKKALADARREAEVLSRVQVEEAERNMQALRDQMAQQQLDHEERLQESLSEQQKEMIDRQRTESLKLRSELQGMETRHQEELNTALQEHVAEMARQRKQLETAHANLLNSLQEELSAAKERCNELLMLSAAKEGQDAALLVEQKARADESLRKIIEERDRQHKIEMESAEALAAAELNKVRLAMDKMKARHSVELLSKEKEGTNDQSRAIAVLKDKHRAEIAKLKTQQEQRLTSAIQEIAGKGKLDYLRLIEEKKADDLQHEAAIGKAEQKIRELNQAVQKQRVEFEVTNLKLIEDSKATAAELQAKAEEEAARFNSLKEELENRLKAKHLLVVGAVREEAAAELARHKAEALAAVQRREAQHATEIEQLRKSAEDEMNARFEELESLQAQLSEMRRKHTAAVTEVKALQQELTDWRAQHEEEAQRSNRLGSDVSELQRRHNKEVQRLKDERADYERMSQETEERLAKELQEVKMASRKLTSELQEAVMEKDYEMQRQLSAQRQQHLSELQEQISQLKTAHQQQLDELHAAVEKETAALKEARAQAAQLSADLAKSTAAMETMQREYSEQIESVNENAATERNFLRDRITRMTQEAEAQAVDIQLAMEKRTEYLEEALEEEKERATQRHEQHLAELQALESQMHTQIQAERVEKANELDALKLELTTAHQREIKELKLKMEAGQALASSLKDEMSARLAAALAEKESQLRELQEHMKQQLTSTLTEREQQLKADFERDRNRLCEQYEDTIQNNLQNSRSELVRRMEELTSTHSAEISAMQKRHAAALRDHVEDSGSEVITLQRQLGEKDEEKRDVERQLVKSEAIREVLKQDTENMRAERQSLREKVHQLELEIIEHGKAKFDARLIVEKERLENSYKAAFDELNQEVSSKEQENKELSHKLAMGEMEIAAVRASIRSAQEDRERLEATFRTTLTEKERAHVQELKSALDAQQEELQAGYLKLIQQQVDSLVHLIQNQSSQATTYDLQERFLMLVRQLPDNWQNKKDTFVEPPQRTLSPHSSPPSGNNNTYKRPADAHPRTPLHLLGQASSARPSKEEDSVSLSAGGGGDHDLDNIRRSRFGGRQSLPWSSPSLRSSPTDQLIAAILDGDVQGIRAVVRSKGEDLRSEFWRELSRSVFPLHRAVSGLHFHGSEKLLVAAIETLAQLGADVNAADHAGNSVLHKAIQVCTSKSAAAVVKTLLQRGANPSLKNKDGDTPLHSECKRVRSASVEVIEALVAAGADPDCRNLQGSSVSPLTLVLLRGAASTSTGVRLIGVGDEMGLGLGLSPPSNSRITADGRSVDLDNVSVGSAGNHSHGHGSSFSNQAGGSDPERTRVAGRRVWIRAAEMLVKCGAHWEVNWQTNKGCNQLHLLLAAFPPSRDDSATYRKLLKSALESGLEVAAEEERGRNALFILCEQMATVGSETCPDAPRLVHMLLGGAHPGHTSTVSNARKVVNSADRTGRTVFDIVERADHSCLAACRQVLRDASQGALHLDSANYTSAPANPARRGHGGHGHGGGNSSSNSSFYGDYEPERPKTTSALIARVSQLSNSSAGNLSSMARGEAEAKKKTSVTYSTTSASSSSNRLATNTAYNSSSYLAEEFAESPPMPLLRSTDGAGNSGTANANASYSSSYYSPAVAPRRSSSRSAYDERL